MTPQQLMDLPYAGMAEKQLRKQGDWSEHGKGEKIYLVNVYGTQEIDCAEVIQVYAESEVEAKKKAIRIASFTVDGTEVIHAYTALEATT